MQRPNRIAAVIVAVILIFDARAQAGVPSPTGSRDFDFLYGTWLVHNTRLVQTSGGGEKWITFDASDTYVPLPGGLGNQDVLRADEYKKGFVAMTIRLYDPATGIWKLYYFNNVSSHGDAGIPNVGKFHGNVGIFDAPFTYRGKPAIDRYQWTKLDKNGKLAPHFEEFASVDHGKTWKRFYFADLIRTGN